MLVLIRLLSVAVLLSANGLHAESIVDVNASTSVPPGGATAIAHIVDVNQTGVKDLNILGSTDGISFTLIVGAPTQFAIGANAAAEPAELFLFSRTASFVR